MQPQVLAWALLFVVGAGAVMRFFSWLGRRLKREAASRPASAEIQPAPNPPAPAVSSVPQPRAAPQLPTMPKPVATVQAAPPPLPPVAASKPEAAVASSAPAPVAATRTPEPNPESAVLDVPEPIPASAFASSSEEEHSKIGAKPSSASVRATLSPKTVPVTTVAAVAPPAASSKPAMPSVAATLPPRLPETTSPGANAVMAAHIAAAAAAAMAMRAAPSRPLAANVSATVDPSAPPRPKPAPPASPAQAITQYQGVKPDARATLMPAMGVAVTDSEAKPPKEEPVTLAKPVESTEARAEARSRPSALRARKLGRETPPLDVRLKNARTRKARPTRKASGKPAHAVGKRGKIVSPGEGLLRIQRRLIKRQSSNGAELASRKPATRIIGVPPRNLRILPSPRI